MCLFHKQLTSSEIPMGAISIRLYGLSSIQQLEFHCVQVEIRASGEKCYVVSVMVYRLMGDREKG